MASWLVLMVNVAGEMVSTCLMCSWRNERKQDGSDEQSAWYRTVCTNCSLTQAGFLKSFSQKIGERRFLTYQ